MSDRRLGSIAAALAAMLFGSAYVATAFQLHGFTPLGAALWRSALAAAALVAIVAARHRRGSNGDRERPADLTARGRAGRLVVLGALGGLVFLAAMNMAISEVGATITSFVAGLYAILAALFAPVVLAERLERRTLLGLAVALLGTALLAELNPSPDTVRGLLAGGAAALSYGLYLVLIRRWSVAIGAGPVVVALATAGVSAVGLCVLLAVSDPKALVPTVMSPPILVATLWLALVAAVGPLLATAALRRIEAALASSILLLNPITATVLAVVLLGERPTAVQLLGGGLVLLGIAAGTDVIGIIASRREQSRLGTREQQA